MDNWSSAASSNPLSISASLYHAVLCSLPQRVSTLHDRRRSLSGRTWLMAQSQKFVSGHQVQYFDLIFNLFLMRSPIVRPRRAIDFELMGTWRVIKCLPKPNKISPLGFHYDLIRRCSMEQSSARWEALSGNLHTYFMGSCVWWL